MQTQFTERELGDCLELVIDHRGKTPKKLGSDWIDAGIPTISAKNVNGGRLVSRDSIRHVSFEVYKRWMKEDVKRGDCFLVSEGATLGECMLWDYDYPIVLGQRIFCLRANPEILNPRFLYAYMTSRSFQDEIIGRATGTSVDGLRQTEVLKLKLLLPPIEQQEQIGDVLYNLNNKIELNRRMNATLEAMARALFQSWFVDFDPVRAKLDGSQTIGLDAATAALFPNEFEDSELGHIPKGWEIKPFGDVADVNWGDTSTTKKSYVPKGFTAYSAAGPDGFLAYHDYNRTGVVVSAIGSAGLSWLALGKWSCIKNTIRFWAIAPGISTEYLYHATKGQEKWPMRGSVQPFISQGDARAMRILAPANGLAERFGEVVRPWLVKIEANKTESRILTALRDTLLPKLLSGELVLNN